MTEAKQDKTVGSKEVDKETTHIRIETPDGRHIDLAIRHPRHEGGIRGMIDEACKTTGIKPRIRKCENAVLIATPVPENIPEKVEEKVPSEPPDLLQTALGDYDASFPYIDFDLIQCLQVSCMVVKFGAFRISSSCTIFFSTLGMKIVINFPEKITLRHMDIERVMRLKTSTYCLLIKGMPYTGESIRKILKIPDSMFNPNSSNSHVQNITLFLNITKQKSMDFMNMLFEDKGIEDVIDVENLTFDVDNYHEECESAILVYPEKRGVAIYPDNLSCLKSDATDKMLNDNILNFYLQWIYHEFLDEESKQKFFIFSSMFLLRLTFNSDNKGKSAKKRHAEVAKWTKNIDLLSKEYIIIPYCIKFHWLLIIVCFPNEVVYNYSEEIPKNDHRLVDEDIPTKTKDDKTTKPEIPVGESTQKIIKTEPPNSQNPSKLTKTEIPPDGTTQKIIETELDNSRRPCILVFDSLLTVIDSTILKILRDYLSLEYAKKHKGRRCIFTKENLPQFELSVPQQKNLVDCGLFTLQYVQEFCKNPLIIWEHFTTDKTINLKDWFTLKVIDEKRQEILDLIQTLKESKK